MQRRRAKQRWDVLHRSIDPPPYFALHARDEETRVTLIPNVIRDVRDRRARICTRDACTHGGQACARVQGAERISETGWWMIPLCVLVARHCRKMALFRPLVRTRNAFLSAPERNWTVFDKYFPTKVLPLSFEIKISLQRYSERARALKAPPEEERNEGTKQERPCLLFLASNFVGTWGCGTMTKLPPKRN